MCNCQSYNRPDWGGDKQEIIVPKPAWNNRTSDTICLDACITDVVLHLWDNGVKTLGSCCGHNKFPPSLVLGNDEDPKKTKELLKKDGRKWDIYQ